MKRTFSELRQLILRELSRGQQTINQLSLKTGINWRTVEAHLDFLAGKGDVQEVLSSEYVRIFRLSEQAESKTKRHAKSSSRKFVQVEALVNGRPAKFEKVEIR